MNRQPAPNLDVSPTAGGDGMVWVVALLLAVLTASAFASNWDIDEGVISLFTDQLQKTGDLRYLFQHHNARFSFSWPYFYLLALVRGDAFDPGTYYLLRLPSLVFCGLSLIAVHECLRVLVDSRPIRMLALVFFVLCCLQLGATRARYDSPYLLGASVCLLTAVKLHQGKSWHWACPGLLAAALAGTTHPVGLGAVGFLSIVLPYCFVARRPSKKEAVVVVFVAVVSAALLVGGLLMGRSPGEFLSDLKGVQDQYHTFTSSTFVEEKSRYLSFLATGGLAAKLFVASVAISLVGPAFRAHRGGIWCCRIGLGSLVLFLAFIPTKWPYYLGLLLPCASVLCAYQLAALTRLRILPQLAKSTAVDHGLNWRKLSQGLALMFAGYLLVCIAHDLWRSAHANTLLARLLRPHGKQATVSRQLSDLLAGKSINLYSDLTILPLLGKADFQRHCHWQPDVGLGEEIELADGGEYLIVCERNRSFTYGFLEKHSQFSRYEPEKLLDACLFNDTFTIYRIREKPPEQEAPRHARSKAGVGPDARLQ